MKNKNCEKPEISVVVPIYGSFDQRRVKLCIDSIKSQKKERMEIILTEQNPIPTMSSYAKKQGIVYVFEPHTTSSAFSDFKTGRCRNSGVINSTGKFIYMDDADILFEREDYLHKLMELLDENENIVFERPPMRRLPLECFDDFERKANDSGIVDAINSLDRSQKYILTLDGKKRDLKVVTRSGVGNEQKTFTTSLENFQRYRSDTSLKGLEPTIWSQDIHCGAIFMRRSQFDNVGGYCENFITWGCEDSDLQWKLAQCYNLQRIKSDEQFEVIHMDHPKGYFLKEMWKKNDDLEDKRRKGGVTIAIDNDKKNLQLTRRNLVINK